jgi:hypothetical protein
MGLRQDAVVATDTASTDADYDNGARLQGELGVAGGIEIRLIA